MVKPNKQWEKKYGAKSKPKESRLSGDDTILSSCEKLAGGTQQAQVIILAALRKIPDSQCYLRLLDMDDMQMYGGKIVSAYREWAKNDYQKLIIGIENRDPSLVKFLQTA